MGSAAAGSWAQIPDRSTDGAEFQQATYMFWPSGSHHGAFEWRGKLSDSTKNDGHNVYVQARVEGQGWSRFNGKQNRTVRLHKRLWNGSQQYVTQAYLRVCRDKGSFQPDNCSPTWHRSR
ncbi:hypothetical protein [Streptomyces sp. NPDC058045]|uniref:hypothetical protein n=1 Tax=Streptomyces sp. NPDC058045 TaxID=3346311 RepID=UPI0036E3477A